MSPLLAYFWPVFGLGVLLGGLGGWMALRRRRPWLLAIAGALGLAGAALWHAPFGAASRLAEQVEKSARATLVDWEMPQVQAHLHRGPLSRRLVLSGPADDFQRSELVRIMSAVPGVSRATWSGSAGIPLLLEGTLACALGFLAGALLAYGVERRRRYNAEWKW